MKRKDLQNAFAPIPQDCYDAMMAAAHSVEEEPVMKRKLSLTLVLAIVLVLVLAGVALAIAHFTDYAGEIARMEADKGTYDSWGAEDRIELVRMLVDSGELEADERVTRLLSGALGDAKASQLATEIFIDWGMVREDTITLVSILERVWGRQVRWTLEQKVWFLETLKATGRYGADVLEELRLPGEGDVPMG